MAFLGLTLNLIIYIVLLITSSEKYAFLMNVPQNGKKRECPSGNGHSSKCSGERTVTNGKGLITDTMADVAGNKFLYFYYK